MRHPFEVFGCVHAHGLFNLSDLFNLLNNPHFNAPGSSVAGTSSFGKITSAGDRWIVHLSLRVRF